MNLISILLIITILLFSDCTTKCTVLSDVNESQQNGEFLTKENPSRQCNSELISKKVKLKINHESVCNLHEFQLLVWLNYHPIYRGSYNMEIPLDVSICKDESYEIVIFLIDSKKQVHYSWHKKDAYTLSEINFNSINISLLEKENYDYNNGMEYKIEFN
ncbi:MAG: hypothetical protein J0M08_12055 [Bacteroidetes bacterium]|nr:hypothetical protein [Bacteroidota bacterium]